MRGAPFLNLVLAIGLVLMVGWLLVIGQAILLPIVLAIIAVYVLTTAAEALERVPLVGRLPLVMRHGLVLLGFTLAVVALALVVSVTLNQLVAVMPSYQANLEALAIKVADYQRVRASDLGRYRGGDAWPGEPAGDPVAAPRWVDEPRADGVPRGDLCGLPDGRTGGVRGQAGRGLSAGASRPS